jgi:hypothetical protein
MTTYMHCRPSCAANIFTCSSSFIFARPDYTRTLNYQAYTPSFYHHHDQVPPSPSPPPLPPRQRRRLEDPIITYASNYYATYPRQMSQSSPQPPPLPPPRQIHQQSDRNGIYCDLFNLLERPAPSSTLVKQRRKYATHNYSPCCHHCHMDIENAHSKVNSSNDRKRHHQQYSSHKEKKRPEDNLLSTEQYVRSVEKTKKMTCNLYQRHSPNKGFFRRVVRNYFCMPTILTSSGYSS